MGINVLIPIDSVLRPPQRLSGRNFDRRWKWRCHEAQDDESAEYSGWPRSGRRQRAESGRSALNSRNAEADARAATDTAQILSHRRLPPSSLTARQPSPETLSYGLAKTAWPIPSFPRLSPPTLISSMAALASSSPGAAKTGRGPCSQDVRRMVLPIYSAVH
jgi:hypothetical protein